MNIFIIRNGVKLGPYTAEEINTQLKTGVFSTSDVARYDGSEALWPLPAVPGIKAPAIRTVKQPQPDTRTPTALESVRDWTVSLRRSVSVIALLLFVGLAVYKHIDGTRQISATPGEAEAALLTRSEWRERLKQHCTVAAGHQLLTNRKTLFAAMGEPDNVQHVGRDTYWYYKCSDGIVQLAFQLDPDVANGQIIAELSDE